MRQLWGRLGGQMGVGLVVLGFAVVFLGWNGAASLDRLPSQFPYLLSGGFTGLSLVIVGAALMVVQNQREDRAKLQASLDEMRAALERMAASGGTNGHAPAPAPADGMVAAGPTAYHRPTCRLLDGRGQLPLMTPEAAESQGLTACRTCRPADDAADTAQMPAVRSRRSRSR